MVRDSRQYSLRSSRYWLNKTYIIRNIETELIASALIL
jgi:hypothetical protein